MYTWHSQNSGCFCEALPCVWHAQERQERDETPLSLPVADVKPNWLAFENNNRLVCIPTRHRPWNRNQEPSPRDYRLSLDSPGRFSAVEARVTIRVDTSIFNKEKETTNSQLAQKFYDSPFLTYPISKILLVPHLVLGFFVSCLCLAQPFEGDTVSS